MMKIENNTNEMVVLNNKSSSSSSSSSSCSSSSMNFNSNVTLMETNNNTNNSSPNILKSHQQTQVISNTNNGMKQPSLVVDSNNNCMIISTTASSDESLCGDPNDISANFNDFTNSKTNLIVNYLPQNMTQDEIKSLFASIGPVDSCKLIKDKLSEGQSLGYAFVNYSNQEDADKAISTLNGMRLQNKTIKVSLARPSSDSIKNANLYVCGLPKEFSQSDLEKMFNQFGVIISSKILTDPKTGVSKGVGFVRFDQRIEAEMAINKLNNKVQENMTEPLIVKFANSPTSIKSVMGLPLAPFIPTCRGFYQPYRSSTSSSYRYSPMSAYCPETATTLIPHQVASLSGMMTPTTANNSLSNSLNCGGTALTTVNSTGAVLGSSTSLGSLVGCSTQQQQQPLTHLTSQHVTTPTLMTSHNPGSNPGVTTTPPATSLSSTSLSSINYSGWCIFVYNLGPESEESILWQLFGPFGAVQSVKIIRDMQTHKCKGFGFVTMTNYEEAITAINCLNGLNLHNRILQVSFKTNKPFF